MASYSLASPHTRALHGQQIETHLQPFWERSLFACPRALALQAGLRFETHAEAMDVFLGQGNAIFVLSLCHTTACKYLAERNVYTQWSPEFHNCYPGKISRSPCSGAQQTYTCCPIGLYIFANSHRCYLMIWLPICLNIGSD